MCLARNDSGQLESHASLSPHAIVSFELQAVLGYWEFKRKSAFLYLFLPVSTNRLLTMWTTLNFWRTLFIASFFYLFILFSDVVSLPLVTYVVSTEKWQDAYDRFSYGYRRRYCVASVFNPLRPSGNYMYHLLWQPVTQHFVFMCFVWFSL
jgi:hypothetical protein